MTTPPVTERVGHDYAEAGIRHGGPLRPGRHRHWRRRFPGDEEVARRGGESARDAAGRRRRAAGGSRDRDPRGRRGAETGGEAINPRFPTFQPQFLRLRPRRIVSWWIEEPGFHPFARTVGADGGIEADGGGAGGGRRRADRCAGGGRRRADRCAGGRCQTRRTMSGDVPTHPWTRPGGLPGSIRRCRRTGRAGPLDAPAARPTGPGSSSSPSSCSSVSAGRSSSRRTLRCSASCPGPRPCPRLRRPPVLPRRAPLQARQPGRRAHPPPVSPGPLRRHRPVRPLGRHPRPSPLLRRPAARCPPGSSPCR